MDYSGGTDRPFILRVRTAQANAHVLALTHRVVEDNAKKEGGFTQGLLRLSVGIEDADHLWA